MQDINVALIVRELGWLFAICLITAKLFLKQEVPFLGILKAISTRKMMVRFLLIACLSIILLFYYGLFGLYEVKLLVLFVVYCSLLKLIDNFPSLNYKKFPANLSFILAFLICILPVVFSPRYLNGESQVSKLSSQLLDKYNSNAIPLSFKPTAIDIDNFNANVKLLQPDFGPRVNFNNERYYLYFDGNNFTAVCLFGNYDGIGLFNKFNSVNQCINSISLVRYIPHLKFNLNKIPGISQDIIGLATDYNDFDRQNSAKDPQITGLLIQYTPGGYFHHYRSIISPLLNGTLLSYFNNQYGPIWPALTKIFADVAHISYFDSLFITVVIANLFVLILIKCLPLKKEYQNLLYIGYIASIWVTFANSNFMAPLLYYGRFFPSVVLLLLLISWGVRKKNPEQITPLFVFLSLFVAVYNFEYAVLTSFSLFVVSLSYRYSRLTWFSLSIFVFTVVFKFILITFFSIGSDTTYAVYLFSKFQGETAHPIVVFYIIIILFFAVTHKFRENFYSDVLLFMLISFSIKPIWNGAPNHIGALFLIMSLFCIGSKKYKFYIRFYIPFIVAILIYSSFAYFNFHLNDKFFNKQYVESEISSLYKVDSIITEQADELKYLKFNRDLLIAQNDVSLSIALNMNLTGPYPDLSTNGKSINYERLLSYCKDCRLFVSKQIEYDQDFENGRKLLNEIVGIDPYRVGKFSYLRDGLKSLVKKFKSDGFELCDQTDSFLVYCSPSTAQIKF